ncbi:MAG: RluA family pseudouridine synthase [Nitrospina sp.]|nr:RluA family pseudouridine synthase [Nitrospina sp.]
MTRLFQPPPAEQVYRSHLPGRYNGWAVEKYFADRFPFQEESRWVEMIRTGKITVNGERIAPGHRVHLHDFIVTHMPARQEPAADRTLQVIFEDRHLRVFNKGAPLPVHPSGRYFQNSMTELLKHAYPDEVPRPVQRLDALTTGITVFAKSKPAATDLMTALKQQRVEKEYLALVHGVPASRAFEIDLPIGKRIGSARGVGPDVRNPRPARTRFEWVGSRDGLSLLRAFPLTGRTNQIRVHLAECGLPIVNDPIYGRGRGEGEAGLGLHAFQLNFICRGKRYRLKAPVPRHFGHWNEFACHPLP